MISACPFCQKQFAVTEAHFGKLVKCPGCGGPIRFPGAEGGDAAAIRAGTVTAPAAAPPPPAAIPMENIPSPAQTGSPTFAPNFSRAIPMNRPGIAGRRGKVGAGIGIGGVVAIVIVGRILLSGAGAAVGSSRQTAVRFNDDIVNSTTHAHQACISFTTAVDRWAESGDAPNMASLTSLQTAAMQYANSCTQRIAGLTPPSSSQGKAFHARAKDLAGVYSSIAQQAFAKILDVIRHEEELTPEAANRILEIETDCDLRLKLAQDALGEAQRAFAAEHSIQLMPNPAQK